MGLLFSGEMSDIAFYQDVERPWVLLATTRTRYGILVYVRYRDDIRICLSCPVELRHEFIRTFIESSKTFRIKRECSEHEQIQFLDLKMD